MFASGKTAAVASAANYIEDVYSTYLYKGNSSTQTITNGIDLSGKGGLTWIKVRDFTYNHYLYDTARGVSDALFSNSTSAQSSSSNFSSFDSSGFTLNSSGGLNNSSYTYASWTFRKQPKFFDVQQVTLDASTNRQIAHNLASVPGVIIGKKTNGSGNWVVYHRSLGINKWLALQTTDAETSRTGTWGTSNPTATDFYFDETYFGSSGDTYIFYLFAHDAGGFGLTGTDNVISCGSYTGNGSATGPTVTLGYEPQWLLVKNATSLRNWFLIDNMRGLTVGGVDPILQPNSSSAEQSSSSYDYFSPTATGFAVTNSDGDVNANGDTYIYIAIRKGPMKVPTSGTSVFSPYITTSVANSGTTYTSADLYSTGFVTDIILQRNKSGTDGWYMGTRLQGTKYLKTETTAAEVTTSAFVYDSNIGAAGFNASYGLYAFKRAPSAFDVVCYTGTGSARTVTHNLGVAPEMMIVKVRDSATDWAVYHSGIGATKRLILNLTDTPYTSATAGWNDTAPTASVFTVGTNVNVNGNGYLYVAYLFATCAGVSKVFSYTGNGSSQTINCGFTAGARWILIKRTDSTGDWYVWDSARGIVSGNDPHLSLNTTAAEVTTDDTIDTDSTGFVVNQVSATNVNVSSATYIGFAVA